MGVSHALYKPPEVGLSNVLLLVFDGGRMQDMNKVTISKVEYVKLRKQAEGYQKLASRLFESVIQDPFYEVVEDFRETNLYTEAFLKDLEDGLQKSSYKKA